MIDVTHTPFSREDRVRSLAFRAAKARRHYEVWRVYSDPDIRARLWNAFDQYVDFVNFDEDTHRSLALLELAGLFEREPKSINFKTVCAELAPLDPMAVEATRALIERHTAIITKVVRLRHTAVAHRAGKMSNDAAYKAVELSGSEFRELIEVAEKIAIALSTACNVEAPLVAFHAATMLEQLFTQIGKRQD